MRLFFNLKHPCRTLVADATGIELDNFDRAEVIKALEESFEEDPLLSQDVSGWMLEVNDASGNVLTSISL